MSWEITSKDPQFNFTMRELSGSKVYEFEDFRLDAGHLLLFRDGRQVKLTPKVVETLVALVERRGELLSKEELMAAVWPETIVEESNLSQNLYLLRKTLGTTKTGEAFIETLRRRGYRFSAEVRVVEGGFKAPAAAPARAVHVERTENIYAVVDWQRPAANEQPDVEHAATQSTPTRSRVLIFAVVALSLIAVVTAAAYWFRPRTDVSSTLGARNELTFTPLTNGIDVNDATISPDGNYIVYHEVDGDRYSLWVQQAGQSTRHELIQSTNRPLFAKTFAPDGRSIFYVALEPSVNRTELYRIPTLGGVPAKIADDAGGTVAVSPDGTRIAYIVARKNDAGVLRWSVMIANADGTDERMLLAAKPEHVIWGGLAWSPDGRTIAYGEVDRREPTRTGTCSVRGVDPEDMSTRDLSSELWDGCGRMAYSPDGRGLFLIGTRANEGLTSNRDQLYLVSIGNGTSRRLTTDGNRHQLSSLGVSTDGAALVVPFNRSSQLWSMDASGNGVTARQITAGAGDGRSGLSPLPDGRIAFITRVSDNLGIWRVNQDGSEPRQVTSEPRNVEELRVSPDGKTFFFSANVDGVHRFFRIDADGSNLRWAVDDDTFDVDSDISPDGEWLVYSSVVGDGETARHRLRYAAAAGGEPHDLPTRGGAFSPRFSPDARSVSYIDADQSIVVVTFPEGRETARFKPLPASTLNTGARWSADSRHLIYIARSGNATNLWLQPVAGGAPRQLTDFTSGEIYNFAFTHDGRRLILARGYPSRNAVLVKIPYFSSRPS